MLKMHLSYIQKLFKSGDDCFYLGRPLVDGRGKEYFNLPGSMIDALREQTMFFQDGVLKVLLVVSTGEGTSHAISAFKKVSPLVYQLPAKIQGNGKAQECQSTKSSEGIMASPIFRANIRR